MKPFKKLKQAITWVETRNKFSPKKDLLRISSALLKMNLTNDFKKIHIAGTNGKGSTASFISNILVKNGLRVGTFTSPYLIRFNERIKMNMVEISDDKLLDYLNYMYLFNQEFISSFGESLVFFEIMTLISLKYFNDMKCDVVVMEVGIGGLLDATNILNYDLSIITNIGFDHMKQLGNSLEEIAENKLGIIKEKNHLITYVDKSLFDLFKESIDKKHASVHFLSSEKYNIISFNPLKFLYKGVDYEISLKGDFQVKNAILSINAVSYLYPDIRSDIIKGGLLEAKNPGRFEVIANNPITIIDGAHNIHGIEALVEGLRNYTDKKISVIFCALRDKNPQTMINKLKTISDNIVITDFKDPRVMNVLELVINDPSLTYINGINKAYKYVKSSSDLSDIILITGSIHFIGYVKKKLKVKMQKTSTI
ncbi:bifunctional folylpolyglutamate synthase/dihydrofolate synthase [Acholeplasma sp. OttesenSCG-928-E16]|nr:bifunctional folylpolyglutamate synthase/dihydrofolate synthase [Acholeplasma sp. OttesenSCG-928-E16]